MPEVTTTRYQPIAWMCGLFRTSVPSVPQTWLRSDAATFLSEEFMKRLGSILLLIFLPMASAQAGPVEDRIVSHLKGYGYTEIEVNRTLLGRSRIVAQKPSALREIVVNPYTGEILRDITTGEDLQDEFGGVTKSHSAVHPTEHPERTGTAHDSHESSSESSDNNGEGGGDGDGSD